MTKTTCHFCTTTGTQQINGCHWTGTEYIRVDVCNSCYSAKKLAKAPRKPHQRKTTTVPASDWNMLVAFSKDRNR